MLRKLLIFAVIAAVIGLFVFWGLTIPATVPASALPQRSPNLENGQTMFYAGGCASCHATPGQDDKTKLGGGFALKSPFGTFHAPNISPDPKRRHRQMERGRFRHRDGEGHVAGRLASLPGVSVHVVPAHAARTTSAICLRTSRRCPRSRAKRSRTNCRSRSTSAARSASGNSCSSTASRSSRTPARTRRGIAAPIWSTVPAIAPNAIRRAISWAASSKASASPAGRKPVGDGFVPNITPKSLSLSQENLVKLLETGETPDGDTIGGEMAKVTSNTGKLGAADREAIATYVRALPPVEGPKRDRNRTLLNSSPRSFRGAPTARPVRALDSGRA